MIGGRKRVIVKPGDAIPLKGVDITVVTASSEVLAKPLPGAGQPNEFAAGVKPEPIDDWDNAGFGRIALPVRQVPDARPGRPAPVRRVQAHVPHQSGRHRGPVHGQPPRHKLSNSKMLVHAVHPKVAIMNNGPRKGGDPEVLDILKSSPGLLDVWQAHFSPSAANKNSPADFIANLKSPCEGKMIKVSAQRDGTFTVTNLRNNFSKTYKP